MTQQLLLCTDLDRTLLPNGPEPESAAARGYFARLAADPRITLAYVTGRHRALVEQAIFNYQLPQPDYVLADVGTTIYQADTPGDWTRLTDWERDFASDWSGQTHAGLKTLLQEIAELRPQERSKQNEYKLSYYVPLEANRNALAGLIENRLNAANIRHTLVWSTDEPAGIGLLDILPGSASKRHAIEALMAITGFDLDNTVFCGDSGNDLEVLCSPIASVLVANSQDEIKQQAVQLAADNRQSGQLYIAQGGYLDMNGNYSAGILEGVAHYHPEITDWISQPLEGNA